MPRNSDIVPMVITMEGTLIRVTSAPLNAPHANPDRQPRGDENRRAIALPRHQPDAQRGQRDDRRDREIDLPNQDQQRHRQRDDGLLREIVGGVGEIVEIEKIRRYQRVTDDDGDEQQARMLSHRSSRSDSRRALHRRPRSASPTSPAVRTVSVPSFRSAPLIGLSPWLLRGALPAGSACPAAAPRGH